MKSFRTILLAVVSVGLLASAAEAQQVVSVEVQGELRKVAKSLILTTVGLEPGIELSQENVQQAVRDLQGLNVFEDIQIWGDPVPEGINLIIMVEEYPALEGLQFKGHKNLKEKDFKEALSLVTGQVIAPRDVVRGEQKILDLYAEIRRVARGEGMFGVDKRRDAARFLRLGDRVQGYGGLSRGLGAVNLYDSSPGKPPDAQGYVESEGTGRDDRDSRERRILAEPHYGTLSELLLYRGYRHFYALVLVRIVAHRFSSPSAQKKGI